jgi:hypothetical protein
MPSVTFTDQENISPSELIAAGDYTFEVIKCDAVIRNGGKTNGCDAFDFQIRIEKHPGCTIWEDITFGYEKLQWKLDTFLKSANFLFNGKPLVKGQAFDITPEDMIGLRGWCTVKVEDYKATTGEMRKTNRVAVWITNKEKLARNAPAPAPEPNDGF